MTIVPALMFLSGKSNWWFPRSLDRILPHIGLEETDTDADVRADGDGGHPGPRELVEV
jgi:RND superfamily putative drug exporter